MLKVQSTGGKLALDPLPFYTKSLSTEGELVDLIEDFSEGRIQFAFVKVKDPNTTLPKYVLIGWVRRISHEMARKLIRIQCGEGVPERTKGYFTSHLATVSKIFHVRSSKLGIDNSP